MVLVGGFAAANGAARAQTDYTLRESPALSSINLPSGLANRLEEGSRLVRTAGGANDPICDVWWVKPVLTKKPAATGAGVLYGQIQPGSLVGLVRFLTTDAEDSRDQKLAAPNQRRKLTRQPDGRRRGR